MNVRASAVGIAGGGRIAVGRTSGTFKYLGEWKDV